MSKDCKQGIGYNCPHIDECKGNYGNITSNNYTNPRRIYALSKNWSNSTKTWANEGNFYACQPENLSEQRHKEMIKGETFYEQDLKKERGKILESAVDNLKELIEAGRRG